MVLLGAIREAWVAVCGTSSTTTEPYAHGVKLHADEEDVTWARGHRSKAANALRALVAMEGNELPPGWSMTTYSVRF